MEENEQITIKKIVRTELQLFLFLILLLVIIMLLIGSLSEFKEILPVFIYIIPILLVTFLIGGFISYKERNNKTFPEKIITMQSPLIVMTLKYFGVNFDESNPKEFYFYYNLLFGVILVVSGVILFFVSGNYKMALIPFIFGVITIVWGIIKRK